MKVFGKNLHRDLIHWCVRYQLQIPHLAAVKHLSTAWYIPRAPPLSTEQIGANHIVLARTRCPSSSRIHILIPNWYIEAEKEASTLHFILPHLGFCHNLRFLLFQMLHKIVANSSACTVVTCCNIWKIMFGASSNLWNNVL